MTDNTDYDKYDDVCSCGDRLSSECSGEWEPDCSLGNSLEHAQVSSSSKTYEEGIAEGKRQMMVELERQGATVCVHRNEAGQISLRTPSGASWDMSKHIGYCLYTHPIPPPDVEELVSILRAIYSTGFLTPSFDSSWYHRTICKQADAVLTKHRRQS